MPFSSKTPLSGIRPAVFSGCLTDHTRTCKSNQGSWLCKDHIAKHGKTCRHTTRCRIRQHRNVKKACIAVTSDCRCCFAICIREIIPSCILAPPEQQNRITGSFSSVACSNACVIRSPTTYPMLLIRNLASHYTDYRFPSTDASFSDRNGFPLILFFFLYQKVFFVFRKINRIFLFDIRSPFLKASFIKRQAKSGLCLDSKIVTAFRTGVKLFFYIFPIDHFYILSTSATYHPVQTVPSLLAAIQFLYSLSF